ncbi:MAG: MAPEG family protein [Acidobacteriota bacterium]
MPQETLRAVSLWAGANVLLLLCLGLLVTRLRIKVGAPVGTGDDAVLERAVRAHGNNAEYVPAALILLFLAGALGLSPLLVHVAGGTLFAARILHAIGIRQIEKYLPPARAVGNVATWLVILCLGAWILIATL